MFMTAREKSKARLKLGKISRPNEYHEIRTKYKIKYLKNPWYLKNYEKKQKHIHTYILFFFAWPRERLSAACRKDWRAPEVHAFPKNSMHFILISCFPQEFQAFRKNNPCILRESNAFHKNCMLSIGISCIPQEFNAFRNNSMLSSRIPCFPQEFHAFRRNSMHSAGIPCILQEVHAFLLFSYIINNSLGGLGMLDLVFSRDIMSIELWIWGFDGKEQFFNVYWSSWSKPYFKGPRVGLWIRYMLHPVFHEADMRIWRIRIVLQKLEI